MSVKRFLGNVMLAGGLALALSGQCANAQDKIFTIPSSSFKDGTFLAKKNAGSNKANPNCVGENVSPPLSWTNVPAGTNSFALLMLDPEGRGIGVDHWIAYGIPASVTGFSEGEVSKPSDKYVGRHRYGETKHLSRTLHTAQSVAAPLHLHINCD